MTNATQDAGADDYNGEGEVPHDDGDDADIDDDDCEMPALEDDYKDEGEVPHDDGGDADIDDDDEDDEDLELFFSMQRMAGVVEEDENRRGPCGR